MFFHVSVQVVRCVTMNEAAEDMAALNSEEHTVWVLSTAGQGDMPHNGEEFWTKVHLVLDYSFFLFILSTLCYS
jgi:hypothetical protein